MAYWTSAFICLGKLLIAGPVIVANARFWSFFPSGRSLIQFRANAASSRMLELARSRKSLISAYCRYCGAWIEITFALDIQSPRTVRTCHSVGTTCLRESGTNTSGCKRLPKLWKINLGFFPRRRIHWQWYFFWRYCTFFQTPNLSWFWSQCEQMFTAKDLIFCYGQAQTELLPYDYFFLEFLVVTVGYITTILGFFSLSFDQKPCNSCGEKLSVFFGSKVNWGCNQKSLPIKDSTQKRTAPKYLFDLQKKATAQVLLSVQANPEVLQKSTVSTSLLSLLTFTWQMDAPVLITTMEPSTIFQISVLAEFCLDLLAIIKHTFSHSKIGRNKLHPFSKISTSVFSLLDFEMRLHSQLLNFFIKKVLFGVCGCQLFWIHGSWVHEISWSPFHG